MRIDPWEKLTRDDHHCLLVARDLWLWATTSVDWNDIWSSNHHSAGGAGAGVVAAVAAAGLVSLLLPSSCPLPPCEERKRVDQCLLSAHEEWTTQCTTCSHALTRMSLQMISLRKFVADAQTKE